MPADIYGGLSALKTMMDIAKSIKDMDSAAARNSAVIELQEKILTAHSLQTELLQKIRELETQLAEHKAWDTEKQRYELKQLASRFVAYVLKAPERFTATPHAICTYCYEKQFKSILQSNGSIRHAQHRFFCPACKTEFACQDTRMDQMIANLDKQETENPN